MDAATETTETTERDADAIATALGEAAIVAAAPRPTEEEAPAASPVETLRLTRVSHRILEIAEDDGSVSEYPVRGKLDVETMAVFLECEDAITTNRNPATGQPLTAREKATYYREAHERVLDVIRERTPNARLSLDPGELLAAMALLCGNLSVAKQIADDLTEAGAALRAPAADGPGDGKDSDPTQAAAAGTGGPLA